MPFSLEAAREIQRRLAERVEFTPLRHVETVAGLDVAYAGGLAYGVAVIVGVEDLRVIETATSINKSVIPYVPTYLAFRELTPMLRAYFKLANRPDVILVDGHGVAHPRRFGIASHIGVVLKRPTVGVAKSRLYGVERETSLIDEKGEEIGHVIYCGGKRYVSVGSHITLKDAVELVKSLCVKGDVLPLRLAHELTQEAKRRAPTRFDQWGEAI
ncbi:MAG: endonuclease V [Pyrobaculum sp.]